MKYLKRNLRWILSRIIPERLFIKLKFKKYFGYFPDLVNPKSFSEKIQWLKLNDRTQLQTTCADKYLVRNFIAEVIGEQYLIPLVFQTYNIKKINPDNLPNYPCVIKTNHDSGGVFFVYDKYKINWKSTRQSLKQKLNKNYYYLEKEWQYKNIKPCIIVEKLLLDIKGNIPFDFKIYCFNGKSKLIQVDKDRGSSNHTRHWYDQEWNKKKIHGDIYGLATRRGYKNKIEIKKPDSFNKMINFSEKIAERFTFVRIDWYEVKAKLYFGEITFHPGGGFEKFISKSWEKEFGKLLDLNN